MRIIAGSAGGIRLQVPGAVARPTSDRVREALFSILGSRVDGALVLDLFAGSGALGLEALSRGAARVDFVEKDRRACVVIEANLAKARLADSARVVSREAAIFLKNAPAGRYDLVFADPPYFKREGDDDWAADLLADEHLKRVISPAGMVVLETAKGHGKNVPADGWKLLDSRRYGDTEVSFFLPQGADE
ncbi:MAG: 16S rRNA (guanine966-N2)-methyltransferase [Pseudoalteromonas tetraodonis]|jgi:16S rRNA (guanine966-N2)-methyltransferase